MPISHSFNILMCNFKLVAKLLFFILVIALVATALFASILGPVFREIFTNFDARVGGADLSFTQNPIKSLNKALPAFVRFMTSHASEVGLRIVQLLALIAGLRFFMTLILVPVSKILHSKMTTGFDMNVLHTLVSSLWQNLLFSLFCSVVITVIDAAILVVLLYFLLGAAQLIGVLALPLTFMLAIFAYSFRMSVVCMWLPEMNNLETKNIFKSFGTALKVAFKAMRKNFICLTVINTITISLILISIVPTFGVLPILLVPSYLVLYTALCNSLSYTYYQKKYFIDNGVTVYQSAKKF